MNSALTNGRLIANKMLMVHKLIHEAEWICAISDEHYTPTEILFACYNQINAIATVCVCVDVLTKQVPSWPQLLLQREAEGDMSSENGCPVIAARREG